MFAPTRFPEPQRGLLARAGHALIDPIRRTGVFTLARCGMAAVSLAIFGAIGLLAYDSGILALALIPIFVFNCVVRGDPGSDGW